MVLPRLIGFRLLQVGAWDFGPDLLAHAGTLRHWRLAQQPCRSNDIGFDGMHFPIASGCIDVVLLAHGLELAEDPHNLLRECERVLSDRGKLLVLGFNPWSPWAMAQKIPGRGSHRFTATTRLYGAGQVCDWLRLLDFEPQRVIRYGVGFPFLRPRSTPPMMEDKGRPWSVAGLAQAWLISARKRVVPGTRIRWRHRRSVRASGHAGLANGARRVDSRRHRNTSTAFLTARDKS